MHGFGNIVLIVLDYKSKTIKTNSAADSKSCPRTVYPVRSSPTLFT